MNIPTIRTARLCLRPWTIEDAPDLFRILQGKDVLKYFPNPVPPLIERVEKYITRQLANWQERGCGHWAVTAPESERLLGWVGLEYLSELDDTEVAYLLVKDAWGQGLATEAARAAVKFGFESAGLDRIIGLVHPENAGSIRVLEKCGLAYKETIHIWDVDLRRHEMEKGGNPRDGE